MIDHSWHWQRRHIRYALHVRAWWHYNPLRSLVGWLRGRFSYIGEAYQRTRPGNPHCYCPRGGSCTELRLTLFSCGLWVWLDRDWLKRPCYCDLVTWAWIPEGHADDIADYGVERLIAEFPEQRERILAAVRKLELPA